MSKYLVAYVSKTNTTKEVAERIGSVLSVKGIDADILPVDRVVDPGSYGGIILGSPVNGMRVLPEINEFVLSLGDAGRNIRGFFILSYIYEHGRKIWKRTIGKEVGRLKRITQDENVAVFGGRISEKMPGIANFLFGLSAGLPLDLRDWNRIEQWAGDTGEAMRT